MIERTLRGNVSVIKPQWLGTLRRIIQLLTAGLFLYLFLATATQGRSPLPVNLFSRLDPLLALSSMVSARRLIPVFAPAIIVVLVTLAVGRVWCGWMCPLGMMLDLLRFRKERGLPQGFRKFKYLLLFVILLSSLLSNLTLTFFDPMTILVRTLTALYSSLGSALTAGRANLPRYVIEGVIISYGGRSFRMTLVFVLFFVAILATNLLSRRFWCRYLCPLGVLLGLISKVKWLKRRVGERCIECGLCEGECTMGTISSKRGFSADPGECILCLNCLSRCPKGVIGFEGRISVPGLPYKYDPSRRQLLTSLGASFLSVGIMRLTRRKNPWLLRPPGARESEFLAKCIRCGRCTKVCPTSALQPSLLEGGWEGIWTPILVPRMGYCDYSCAACGKVCPTGAIPLLSLEEKRRKVIGTAYVDWDRCIGCMICLEVCPVPGKAIIEAEEFISEIGEFAKRPLVVGDLCIGCGMCEYVCPTLGEAAIRVCTPASLS
ncbi:MAG TPA: 4Fe-4S binding protein [Candidatus Latescibacteria bacterium]|nr:4Fe-4S binding protein [Candidatus Latescibacterota bacterium]